MQNEDEIQLRFMYVEMARAMIDSSDTISISEGIGTTGNATGTLECHVITLLAQAGVKLCILKTLT